MLHVTCPQHGRDTNEGGLPRLQIPARSGSRWLDKVFKPGGHGGGGGEEGPGSRQGLQLSTAAVLYHKHNVHNSTFTNQIFRVAG